MADINLSFEAQVGNIDKVLNDINKKVNNIKTSFNFSINATKFNKSMDSIQKRVDKLTTSLKSASDIMSSVSTSTSSKGRSNNSKYNAYTNLTKYNEKKLENQFKIDKLEAEAKILDNKKINAQKIETEVEKTKTAAVKRESAALALKNKQDKINLATTNRTISQQNTSINIAKRLSNYMNKYSTQFNSRDSLKSTGNDLLNRFKSGEFNNLTGVQQQNKLNNFMATCREAGIETDTLRSKIANLFKEHLSTALVMVGVHSLTQGLQEIKQNVIDLDTSLTQLAIVTDANDNQLKKYFEDASQAAKEVGSDIVNIIDSATTYARLGYHDSAVDLAKLTAKYATAGGFDVSNATTGITSILQSFKDVDVSNLEGILDKMVLVGNTMPISAEELSEGIQNAGSALSAANGTAEQTIALMTAANASVQNISKSSTALRTISARIRGTSTELKELGEELDSSYNITAKYRDKVKAMSGVDILQSDGKTFKDTYQILQELSKVWDKLTDVDKAGITEMLAGTRQQNVFASLMNNFKLAEESMSEMETAGGTLDKSQEKYLNSIEGKTEQTKAKFEEFSNSILNSAFVKGTVDFGGNILTGLTAITDKLGSFPSIVTIALGALSAFGNKGVFTLRDNYDNKSGLEFDSYFSRLPWSRTAKENKTDLPILDNYISQLKNTEKALTETDISSSNLSSTNKNLALNVVRSNKEFKNQITGLEGVKQGLQKTTMGSKLAATGMRLLAAAGNMVIGMAISFALSKIVEGIQYLTTTVERAKESTEELFNEYNESMESISSANEFIADESTLKDYIKLSKGVNSLGENVSLTSEELNKYHEISNKIAELFPNLVKGWDSENNAIVTTKDNLQDYINLLKEQNKLKTNEANQKLLDKDKAKDIWTTYDDEVNPKLADSFSGAADIDKEWGVQKSTIEFVLEAYNLYKKEQQKNKKEIESLNDFVSKINSNEKDNAIPSTEYSILSNLIHSKKYEDYFQGNFSTEALDEVSTAFKKIYNIAGGTYQGLINYQNTLDSKIDQSTQNVKKLGIAYLQTDASFGKQSYWDLDENKQKLVLNFANNISSSFMKGVESEEEYYKKLDEFADVVSQLTPNQMKEYNSVVDISTKFNNGEVSYETWKKQVDAFLNLFKDEDTKKTFKLAFDVDETNGNYNRAVNMLKSVDGAGGKFTGDGSKGSINVHDVFNKLSSDEIEYYLENNISEKIQKWASKNPNADAKEIAEYIQKVIKKAKSKAQGDTSVDLSSIFDNLTNFGKAIKTLDTAYSELKNDNGVSFDTLSSIQEQFKNVDGLDNYINKLAEAKGNTKETAKIMNNLTSAYVKSEIGAENLANANIDVVSSLLKENGVANSNEVAHQLIAQAKIDNAIASGDFSNKTATEISNLLKEAGVSNITRKAINLLILEKALFNESSLDTSKSINNLINLANAAGITGQKLADLTLLYQIQKDIENGNVNNKGLATKRVNELKEKIQSNDYSSSIKFDDIKYTGNSTSGSSSSGSGKSSNSYTVKEDKWLDKREKELEKLKHKHEMGVISEDKYYQEVNKIYKKFAPKIKSKKAQIAKLRSQISNTDTSSDKGKKTKKNLKKDLKQAKKELDEIQSKSNELIESVHENKVKKVKEDYSDWQEIYLNNYLDGKIKSVKSLKKKLKKWLKEHAKVVDKDTYKELLKDLPDWLDDAQQKKFEKKNNKLDTQHDFDLINDKDYYKKKVQLAQKFYKNNEDYKDEYIDSVKSLYDYCKDQYKEDIENQKEALEDQKEILEDKKDAIQDFYDKQIELLEDADELDKYYSDQADKRKTVNDLKSQINQLQRDKDSAVAQKRIKELQSDLKDAEKELADFEKERALQETIAMLQEQCNNEIKAIENQIESIDDSIKSLDKTLQDVDKTNSATYNVIRAYAIKNGLATANELPSAKVIQGWYASGTSNSKGGLSVTQENGAEAVGINLGNGRFTYLTPESKVISASASKLLYEFANNPQSVLNDLLKNTNNNANAIVQNVANDNTQNVVNVNVQVQGNVDKTIMDKMGDELAYKVLEQFKKLR